MGNSKVNVVGFHPLCNHKHNALEFKPTNIGIQTNQHWNTNQATLEYKPNNKAQIPIWIPMEEQNNDWNLLPTNLPLLFEELPVTSIPSLPATPSPPTSFETNYQLLFITPPKTEQVATKKKGGTLQAEGTEKGKIKQLALLLKGNHVSSLNLEACDIRICIQPNGELHYNWFESKNKVPRLFASNRQDNGTVIWTSTDVIAFTIEALQHTHKYYTNSKQINQIPLNFELWCNEECLATAHFHITLHCSYDTKTKRNLTVSPPRAPAIKRQRSNSPVHLQNTSPPEATLQNNTPVTLNTPLALNTPQTPIPLNMPQTPVSFSTEPQLTKLLQKLEEGQRRIEDGQRRMEEGQRMLITSLVPEGTNIFELWKKIENSKRELDAREAALRKRESNLTEKETKCKQLEEDLRVKLKQVETTETRLKETENERTKQFNEQTKCTEHLQIDLQQQKQQVEQLQQELRAKEEYIKKEEQTVQKESSYWNTEMQKLKVLIQSNKQEKENLQKERAELQRTNEELFQRQADCAKREMEVAALQKQKLQLQKQIKSLEQLHTNKTSELNNLKVTFRLQTTELDRLQEEIARQQTELVSLKSGISEHSNNEKQQLHKKIEAMEKLHDTQMKQMQVDISRKDEQIIMLNAELMEKDKQLRNR